MPRPDGHICAKCRYYSPQKPSVNARSAPQVDGLCWRFPDWQFIGNAQEHGCGEFQAVEAVENWTRGQVPALPYEHKY